MAHITRIFEGDTWLNSAGNPIKAVKVEGSKITITSPNYTKPYIIYHRATIDSINTNFFKEYRTEIPNSYRILVGNEDIYRLLGKLRDAYVKNGMKGFERAPKTAQWYSIYPLKSIKEISVVVGNPNPLETEICKEKLLSIINTLNLNKNVNRESQKYTKKRKAKTIIDEETIPETRSRREDRGGFKLPTEVRKIRFRKINSGNKIKSKEPESRIRFVKAVSQI